MKFRTRIIMVYAVFVVIITILVGGMFYYSSVKRSVSQELGELEDLSRQLNQQYEESVGAMKNVSHYVLSDTDVLQAIRELSLFPKDADFMSLYFSEAAGKVRNILNADYIISNFYRVIFFNKKGVVVSTVHAGRKLDANADIDRLPWAKKLDSVAYGDFAILGLHEDDWGEKKQEVFSVVKELQGNELGYIEVQKQAATMEALFEISNPDIKVLLIDSNRDILFSNNAYDGDGGYSEFFSLNSKKNAKYRNTVTENDEFLAGFTSEQTGTTLIVAKRYDTIKSELRYIFAITLTLAGSFIGLCIIYILAASNHLAKPMQELKALMERTDLDNISQTVGLKASTDEIEVLRQSYENMLKRLDSAIVKEKRTALMQFQAQFDALQAQVNPHFIYNTLNVISSRGILNNDEVVCEICDGLAAMLRYSTNIKERYAVVGTEVEYLEAYMRLLKRRYEHRLEYNIDVDPEMMNYLLPKIVLQQLVENSISHGYEKKFHQVMKLDVAGWLDSEGWCIRVRDNGEGFSQQALQHIRDEINQLTLQIRSIEWNVELEIGGMGIANTYARMYLLYSDNLVFTVDNHEQGAEVFFAIHKTKKKE